MKKAVSVIASVLTLLALSTAGARRVNVAKANFIGYLPEIVIKSDGTVEPETEFINKTGNVYTLTANLTREYAIKIQCSNIIFDGAGHIIDGSASPLGYSNIGLSLENVNNVTVKDIKVCGFINRDISIENSSECYILRVNAQIFHLLNSNFNTITESNIQGNYLLMRYSNSNVLFRNNITGGYLDTMGGNSNTFFENNFACVYYSIEDKGNYWDNGSIGNYWSDYLLRYPNAAETGSLGIGDTPYVVGANNIDNYPLMGPFIVPPSPEPQPEEPLLAIFAAVVSGVALTAAAACMFYYHNKRNH